jgi:putative ABC transport system permease protein
VTDGAVLKAARSGVLRRPVQTIVILCVVMAASAAGVLGLSLATSANEQFLGAFAKSRGADLAVTFTTAKVTSAELARTRHLAGVTQVTGPYPETAIFIAGPGVVDTTRPPAGQSQPQAGSGKLPPHVRKTTPGRPPAHPPQRSQPGAPGAQGGVPQLPLNPLESTPETGLAVVGRASPSGPLDKISLQAGRWATRPGEIDIQTAPGRKPPIGSTITVTSAPGSPKFTVVGWASSITEDDEAWVAPGQVAGLRATGAPAQEEMLYDFSSAGDAAHVSADLAEISRALPAGLQ